VSDDLELEGHSPFSNAMFHTVVQQWTRFQLTTTHSAPRVPSATPELVVGVVLRVAIPKL